MVLFKKSFLWASWSAEALFSGFSASSSKTFTKVGAQTLRMQASDASVNVCFYVCFLPKWCPGSPKALKPSHSISTSISKYGHPQPLLQMKKVNFVDLEQLNLSWHEKCFYKYQPKRSERGMVFAAIFVDTYISLGYSAYGILQNFIDVQRIL